MNDPTDKSKQLFGVQRSNANAIHKRLDQKKALVLREYSA
jgi:hypothetical protein